MAVVLNMVMLPHRQENRTVNHSLKILWHEGGEMSVLPIQKERYTVEAGWTSTCLQD